MAGITQAFSNPAWTGAENPQGGEKRAQSTERKLRRESAAKASATKFPIRSAATSHALGMSVVGRWRPAPPTSPKARARPPLELKQTHKKVARIDLQPVLPSGQTVGKGQGRNGRKGGALFSSVDGVQNCAAVAGRS